jgi:coenzyme F420-reducing hydrogenase alpha subunit
MADIIIDPVTRIRGNASVRIVVDEGGNPQQAFFRAFGYRGFEQIAREAHVENLIPIVSRICGGDSISHQVAAVTAVEDALGLEPPQEALRIRELAMWGQLFERHAVSLTVHSLPDLLFPSSDPGLRNIISINRVDEEVVKRVMALKSLGTYVAREVGGKAVHGVNFMPGGVVFDISDETRAELIERLNEAKPLLIETGRLIKLLLRRNEEAVNTLGTAPTSYLSLKSDEGMTITGKSLTVVNAEGESPGVLSAREATGRLEESNLPHSHIRSARLSESGEVRVGPLARLNVNRRYGTELADEELEEVKSQWGFPLHQSMIGHAARILEMINAWEKMIEILGRTGGDLLRVELPSSAGKGVGVVEAPEGTLFYSLVIDEGGLVKELSFTTPLQFNINALERTLQESAQSVLGRGEPEERAIVLLETAIRAYAPCIPCGVH